MCKDMFIEIILSKLWIAYINVSDEKSPQMKISKIYYIIAAIFCLFPFISSKPILAVHDDPFCWSSVYRSVNWLKNVIKLIQW